MTCLTARQFLGHVEQETAVAVVNLREKALDLLEKPRVLVRCVLGSQFVGGAAMGQVRQFRRLVPLVEKSVERDLEGCRKSLQSFEGRHGMAILDARDVTAEQPRPFLNIPLRKVFLFPQLTQSESDDHGGILSRLDNLVN